jgi:hypothetical protein
LLNRIREICGKYKALQIAGKMVAQCFANSLAIFMQISIILHNEL